MGVEGKNLSNCARQRTVTSAYFDRSGTAVTKGLLFASNRRFYIRKAYAFVSGVEAFGAGDSTITIGYSSDSGFDNVMSAGTIPAATAAGTVVDITSSLLIREIPAGTMLIWTSAQVAAAGEFCIGLEIEFYDDDHKQSVIGKGS